MGCPPIVLRPLATELRLLSAECQAKGVWIGVDISWPFLVRWRAPLYTALGKLCFAGEDRSDLATRILSAIGRLRVVGRRSVYAEWFERDF